MVMRVQIKKSDKHLGIKAGEVYWAELYAYDMSKVILLNRVPDGRDPSCTQYLEEVEILNEPLLS